MSSFPSDCVIISGTLEIKFPNNLFAYFHRRFVQLVFTQIDDGNHVSCRYEMRFFKTKTHCKSPSYSFVIDPESIKCNVVDIGSKSRPFWYVPSVPSNSLIHGIRSILFMIHSFECTADGTSIYFSARTEYERTAWLSILGHLQYPSHSHSHSNSNGNSKWIPSRIQPTGCGLKPYRNRLDYSLSMTTDSPVSHSNPMKYPDKSESSDCTTAAEEEVSHILSLTQSEGSNDNLIFYNYQQSTLYGYRGGRGHCASTISTPKVTILGLLSDGIWCSLGFIERLKCKDISKGLAMRFVYVSYHRDVGGFPVNLQRRIYRIYGFRGICAIIGNTMWFIILSAILYGQRCGLSLCPCRIIK